LAISVRAIDTAELETQHDALEGHDAAVVTASFSPDGGRIVTGSDDNTARVWDAASGSSLHVLEGHANSVITASFSPDGARIVTGSWDNTSRVWNVVPRIAETSVDGKKITWRLQSGFGQGLLDRADTVIPSRLTERQRAEILMEK